MASEDQVYIRQAFDKMLPTARRVGDGGVNVQPFGDGTMSIAALITHCVGLTEFWLGHVALGRPSDRDRDAEFVAESTLAELEPLVAAATEQADRDVAEILGAGGRPSELRQFIPAEGTDRSVILHVLEELYQHLGHMEITADILERRVP